MLDWLANLHILTRKKTWIFFNPWPKLTYSPIYFFRWYPKYIRNLVRAKLILKYIHNLDMLVFLICTSSISWLIAYHVMANLEFAHALWRQWGCLSCLVSESMGQKRQLPDNLPIYHYLEKFPRGERFIYLPHGLFLRIR